MDDQKTTTQSLEEDLFSPQEAGKGVVVIEDQKYAVNLLWQPLQNNNDPIPEIRETLESEGNADLYCLRGDIQYGIAKTILGHHDGMPSLAATVATSLGDFSSYCGVFQVEEGWWFIAVRNNLILSEEDVLYQTEEEALRAFTSMMAVPDWELKIVPASWQIEGTEQRSLAELVRNGRKVRLTEINAVRKTKFLLVFAIAIVLVVLSIIYAAFNMYQKASKQTVIPQAKPPEMLAQQPPTPDKAKPWEKIIDAEPFMKKCWENAYQIKSVVIPGWKLGLISCTPEGISTAWQRDSSDGLLSWMRFGLDQYQFTGMSVNVADDGSTAVGTVVFDNLPIIGPQPTLTATQLEEDLNEIVRSIKSLQLNFTRQQLQDPPNRPDGSKPPNQKTFTFFQFSVTSDYAPWEWIHFFNKFTALELLKIEYNPSNDTTTKWKYEGRIYAKPSI